MYATFQEKKTEVKKYNFIFKGVLLVLMDVMALRVLLETEVTKAREDQLQIGLNQGKKVI